jgi:hypothetical protein
MRPDQPAPARPPVIALALAAALLIVAMLWRMGLPDVIAYGLGGGLVACLIIISLDRLHSVERRLNKRDAANDEPPRKDER